MGWEQEGTCAGVMAGFFYINEWKRERVPDSRDGLDKQVGTVGTVGKKRIDDPEGRKLSSDFSSKLTYRRVLYIDIQTSTNLPYLTVHK